MVRKIIQVSKTLSGLNFYLCPNAAAQLGGAGAKVALEYERVNDGEHSFFLKLRRSKAGNRVCENPNNPKSPFRIYLQGTFPDLPEFGPTNCEWSEGGAVTGDAGQFIDILVPPQSERVEPRARHKIRGKAGLALQSERFIVQQKGPVKDRLGDIDAAIRQLNSALEFAPPDLCLDVEQGEGPPTTFEVRSAPVKLVGRVTRVLGRDSI